MATFTKLRSGNWGVRVKGTAAVGQSVTVQKKDGSTKTVTVSAVVWQGNGVTLCAIDSDRPQRSRYTWRERENAGDRFLGTQYEGQYCGYPCPVSGRRCCPGNGPCHDRE